MKNLIIYKSKTGYTKQYAQWLSDELDSDIIPYNDVKKVDLKNYDRIIYGGGIYATKINGLKKMMGLFSKLPNKQILVFSVGASGTSDEVLEAIRTKNMHDSIIKYPIFYLEGGFDLNKINVFMKLMLKVVAKSLIKKEAKHPEQLTTDDKIFLKYFQSSHTSMDKMNLQEILDYISR